MRLADQTARKAAAARAAVELVEDGMLLGLGSGTTATLFVNLLLERVRAGLQVTAVPTSNAIAQMAAAGGIEVVSEIDRGVDLDVDGADEIDPHLNLLKGRGGALVREKLVAAAARRFVVIADSSKLVTRLGDGPLPVEVLPFLWQETARRLERLGLEWTVRGGEATPFVTDNGNFVLDCAVPGGIADPSVLGPQIKSLTGVIDHGIFAGLAQVAFVGEDAGVRVLGQP
jgi:ribose 5-phosphate isomerase A